MQEFHLGLKSVNGTKLDHFYLPNFTVSTQETASSLLKAEVKSYDLNSDELYPVKLILGNKTDSINEQMDEIFSLDNTERIKLEENDEENDAKLFWDVVNSINQWHEHKQKQEELKTLGGLTR